MEDSFAIRFFSCFLLKKQLELLSLQKKFRTQHRDLYRFPRVILIVCFFDHIQIRMKPGKPLAFAEITTQDTSKPSKTVLAFGLPGNPVSCMVCFNLFVVPAIRLLSGWSNPHLQRSLSSFLCLSSILFSPYIIQRIFFILCPQSSCAPITSFKSRPTSY